MTQSFSMGVRQRRDVRVDPFQKIAIRFFKWGSMKVLAYNLQQVGVVSATAPAPESVRDRRAAGRVGCEGASTDAPHVLAFALPETTHGVSMFHWTLLSTITLFSLWRFGIIGG